MQPRVAPKALPNAAPKAVPAQAAIAGAPDRLDATLPSPSKFARFAAPPAVAVALDKPPANDNGAADKLKADRATLGKLVDVIGPLAPQLLVGLSATVVRWAGRVPEIPDADIVAKLQECTDLLIKQKLPDMEIGPWAGLGIYGGMTFLSMYMGAEKLPPKKPKLELVPPSASPPRTTTVAPAPVATPEVAAVSVPPAATIPPATLVNPLAASGSVATVESGFADGLPEMGDVGSATENGNQDA